MTRILFLVFSILVISCKSKNINPQEKYEVVKQYDYFIIIDVWNSLWGYESKFILNNLYINDSLGLNIPLQKPLTLYHISYSPKNQPKKSNSDTIKIAISKNISDTLFILTKNFLENIILNNYDTMGQIISKLKDDSHAVVQLSYRGRTLSAIINSINNPKIGTKELDTLLNFVDRFKPKKLE